MKTLTPITRELIFEKIISLNSDISFMESVIERMDYEFQQMKFIELDILRNDLDTYKKILFNDQAQ